MRVFLDANVLFSASAAGSPTRRLLDCVLRHGVGVTNEHAWEEARRNVANKRSRQSAELMRLRPRLEFTRSLRDVAGLGIPDKDQPVIGGATAAHCTHLWTGDKRHFGTLYGRVVHGTLVVSGPLLADELAARGWLN